MRRALLALALVGCASEEPALVDEPPPALEATGSPAGPGSAVPALGVAANGEILLAWVEHGELRLSRYADGGWQPPTTIAEGALGNRHDPPKLAAGADGSLAVAWTVAHPGGGHAMNVMAAVSADGGAVWTAPTLVHRDGTATEHGFASLVPREPGGFELFWLDGRSGGDSALRRALLRGDGSVEGDAALDARVCDCCPTDGVRLADGRAAVVYRDRSAEEVRDISLLVGDDAGWGEPRTVHADGWKIAGCPVNGPAIARAGGEPVVAWYTGEARKVRVAFAGSAPIDLPASDPVGRVDVAALDDGSAYVSWVEGGSVRLQRVTPAGREGETLTVVETDGARALGLPRLVATADALWVAWTESSGVRTARLGLT